jgi:dTMP kinase
MARENDEGTCATSAMNAGPQCVREGKFITLEGVDGAGKSTHIPALASRLRARGIDVLVTREPGGTTLAESLRELLLSQPMDPAAETLLLFAARSDHVHRVILPALEAGRWVLCDRFTDATRAYQGAGKGVPANLIDALARAVHPEVMPDRTLVFDCRWKVARARLLATGRPLDRFEQEDREFFDRVRAAYLDLARRWPDRIRVIDAEKPLAEINVEVEESISTL